MDLNKFFTDLGRVADALEKGNEISERAITLRESAFKAAGGEVAAPAPGKGGGKGKSTPTPAKPDDDDNDDGMGDDDGMGETEERTATAKEVKQAFKNHQTKSGKPEEAKKIFATFKKKFSIANVDEATPEQNGEILTAFEEAIAKLK